MFAQNKLEGIYTPDSLLAGESDDVVVVKVILAAGAGNSLQRGHLLGKITASSKYTLSTSAAQDGSQSADAILAHDVDASVADQEALIYLSGQFSKEAVKFGAGQSLASVFDTLRSKGIFLL